MESDPKQDLLEEAFRIIQDEEIDSIHELAQSLVDYCPATVVDCFGSNPFETMHLLVDFLEAAEYEDEVTKENLSIPEWIDFLASDGAKRLYSICEEMYYSLKEKEESLESIKSILKQ